MDDKTIEARQLNRCAYATDGDPDTEPCRSGRGPLVCDGPGKKCGEYHDGACNGDGTRWLTLGTLERVENPNEAVDLLRHTALYRVTDA